MPLGDSLRDWDYTRNLFARITPEENKLLMRAFSGSPPALIFKAMGWNGREDLVVATEHSRWWENGGYFFLGAFEAGRIASLETKRGSINAAPILEALKSGRDEKLMDALVKYVSYYAHSLCDFWLPELIDKILLRYPEAIPEAYGGVMGREHDDAPEMFAYLNERFPLPRATRIRMVGNLEIPCEQEKLLRAFLPPDMSEEEYHALGASILGAIREGGDVDAEHDGETGCNLWGDLPYPGGIPSYPSSSGWLSVPIILEISSSSSSRERRDSSQVWILIWSFSPKKICNALSLCLRNGRNHSRKTISSLEEMVSHRSGDAVTTLPGRSHIVRMLE